jgi:hypothetical protein
MSTAMMGRTLCWRARLWPFWDIELPARLDEAVPGKEQQRQQQRQQQIPFGNDKQKGNSNDKSRFPSGMTNKKAAATATADSLRE